MNKKYFIAIVVPSPAFEEIESIKTEISLSYNISGALRSPAHITLHMPFEWKENKQDKLIKTLNHFSFNNPFIIDLNNYGFFEPRVVFINVKENVLLQQLHNELKYFCQKNLGLLNEIGNLRGFYPHVTIAFRDLKKTQFYKLQADFLTRQFLNSFNYRGFSLLKLEKKWEVIHKFLI